MIKYLLILIFVLSLKILFAQNHYFDTSCVIHKHTFRFQTKEINDNQIKLSIFRNSKIIKTDTLDSGGLSKLTFLDIDKDGNKDLMLTYSGNNFTYNLYLFDAVKNTFKFVNGFDKFPDAIQLKTKANYYYSYHRAGCADMNWVSDLFYINNFECIQIGHIYGQGCESEESAQMIKIFKITNNQQENKKLLEELPYLKNIPTIGNKWDFVEKYWNTNYKNFN